MIKRIIKGVKCVKGVTLRPQPGKDRPVNPALADVLRRLVADGRIVKRGDRYYAVEYDPGEDKGHWA